MESKDLVIKIMNENNGILTSEYATRLGIDNKILQRMHKSGEIERLEHGMYMDSNHMEDEYLLTQYRCKRGIFSHETALFFHDLSDRTPFQLMLTIPSGYNTRLLKDKQKYKFFYIKEDFHLIGETIMMTPFGNKVHVYDKERTICDCLKKKKSLDTDLVLAAVKQYMRSSGSDFAKLLKYAEVFNIRDLVYQYMEVLS
jgi:predicted transcriptional regulator of viral defense system